MTRLTALAVMLVFLTGCGASMTDAQKIWCSAHDMTPLLAIGGNSDSVDDAVQQAAKKLGITVPEKIANANSVFALANLSGDLATVDQLPDGWPDEIKAWRTTSDYARACVAAFDSK